MRRTLFFIITAAILCCGLFASGPTEVSASDSSLSLTDASGEKISITLPVNRIVTLNSGISEIFGAFGAADRLVGRDSYSTFPESVRRLFVVGRNSNSPNMEYLLSRNPDLVIADLMFDGGNRKKLESMGIPVLIVSTSNPDALPDLVQDVGRILEEPERAKEIISIMNQTLAEIQDRLTGIADAGRTKVFFENRKPYKSASSVTGHHRSMELAGGINIAANEPVASPELNPEFIIAKDPAVILRRVSGDVDTDTLCTMRQALMERPGLVSTQAVREGRVHVIKTDLLISLRFPIGVLYYASWFYPQRFSDIDQEEYLKKYVVKLFGPDEWSDTHERYVYP